MRKNQNQKNISSQRMLIAGDLMRGEHFQLRKNGKYYTVHCQVMSSPIHDSNEFDRMQYTLAVSSGKMYVFDTERTVIACNNGIK